MRSKLRYYLFALIATSIIGCTNSPDFPLTPELTYIAISKSSMIQNSLNTDSIFIQLSFTDGDGDIGGETNNLKQNLLIKDNRTGEFYDRFRIPEIPQQGAGNGISGEITIRLFTTCCIYPDETPPCDAPPSFPTNDLTLDITMVDRAGNVSNVVTTDPITLLCD